MPGENCLLQEKKKKIHAYIQEENLTFLWVKLQCSIELDFDIFLYGFLHKKNNSNQFFSMTFLALMSIFQVICNLIFLFLQYYCGKIYIFFCFFFGPIIFSPKTCAMFWNIYIWKNHFSISLIFFQTKFLGLI